MRCPVVESSLTEDALPEKNNAITPENCSKTLNSGEREQKGLWYRLKDAIIILY